MFDKKKMKNAMTDSRKKKKKNVHSKKYYSTMIDICFTLK